MTMRRRSQRGQVLVIFTGGIVLLLAIASLVIDLGFVWMIRRQEQNAADPGALAAARYIRYGTPAPNRQQMSRAACFYAQQNGFFTLASGFDANANGSFPATSCVPANDTAGSQLEVFHPPRTVGTGWAGDDCCVEVRISRPHRSFFAGVIGMPTIGVASSAIGAFNTGNANSSSLVALNAEECSTIQINGNADISIQPVNPGTLGGYIQVNSVCGAGSDGTPDACSGGGQGALDIGGGADLIAPHAYVTGRCKQSNGSTFVGGVTEGAPYADDPLGFLIGPRGTGPGAFCEPLGRNLVPGDDGCVYKQVGPYILQPGVYYGGIGVQTNKPKLDLMPGIYIMAGGGFNPTNGEVDSSSGDIMIYSTDVWDYYGSACASAPNANYCQGDIHINGQVNIDLSGLNADPCPPVSIGGCPYVGVLFWQDSLASKALSASPPRIIINGGTNLQLAGTIYNPTGEVQLNGGSSTSGCVGANQNCAAVQIISDTITINGGAGLVMPYDEDALRQIDTKGLIH
jgi:hypothetical protein